MKKSKKLLIIFCCILTIVIGSFIFYVNNYYRMDLVNQEYLVSDDGICVERIDEGYFFDGPGQEKALIFYPGGKVEYEAYARFLNLLSRQGVDCFLLKMPCNLAFFGKDKANEIISQYAYDEFYIMGHSLGGAFAAVYASEHADRLSGLCMLAAYPTSKLADSLKVLTIYGSNDQVVNREKLEAGKAFSPTDAEMICIEGGNHAIFGNYGIQEGDGIAAISFEEQQQQTIEAITSWINKN